jgi:tight adherence protein B
MRLALAAAVLAAAALPSAAVAGITLKAPDISDYPTMRLTVVTSHPVRKPPTLRENGRRVADVVAKNRGTDKAVVIAIDRSRSMAGKRLDDAVAAARALLRSKRPDDPVELVAFAESSQSLTSFSTDPSDAAAALSSLAANGELGTALYETVAQTSDALSRSELLNRVLIVITDGRDVSTQGSLREAIDAARDSGVAVYAIAIGGGSHEPLRQLAGATGGTYSEAASSGALTGIAAAVSRQVARTWQLTYETRTAPGDRVRLTLSQPGAGTITRTIAIPTSAGRPPDESGVSKFLFHSAAGNLLFALLIGLVASLGVMYGLSARDIRRIRRRLEPHVPAREDPRAQQTPRRFAALSGLFATTERVVGRTRVWRKLGEALERADASVRPAELFWLMLGGGLVLGLLLLLVGLPSALALLAVPLGAALPYAFVAIKGSRRQAAFDEQLADVLMTMAASVRVGHTFRQSMQAVVRESQEPASKEFKRVLLESDLGRPPDRALADMAKRLGSTNFDYVVSVVAIQREVGGSLATLFDMVAETVRQRQQFAKKMHALTSMGRISAYVLCVLPFVVVAAMSALNYDYMSPLFTTAVGRLLIVLALAGMAVGSLVLKKIVSFRMA